MRECFNDGIAGSARRRDCSPGKNKELQTRFFARREESRRREEHFFDDLDPRES